MIYKNKYTSHISFPLGGIGTGSLGLSGTGRLIDWEIFGRPNKESYNGYSHFALKIEKEDEVLDARVLNSDLPPPYVGNVKTHWLHSGYGFGPDQITMAGLPHFKSIEFKGEFPVATLKYFDKKVPSSITLKAFNPFIPLEEDASSLPGGFFEFEIENPTECALDYTIALSVQNPTGTKGVMNRFEKNGRNSFLKLGCDQYDKDDYRFGNICIATDADDVSYQEYWYRGGWSDGIESFWNDFIGSKRFRNRRYETDFSVNQQMVYDVGTLAVHKKIRGKETARIRFVLTWYYPNMIKNWEPKYHPDKKLEDAAVWKHYYATLFGSAYDCAKQAIEDFEQLYHKTLTFKEALFQSSLPDAELDAIASNLSTLKSPTVLRLEDGSFYGFEGCIADSGCCEGSCQHVWNYAYALPFLFPKLERSMRESEFTYSMRNDGRMGFRLQLPVGTPPEDFRACVDGQMGAVIKAYREWKICGDDAWLRSLWPAIKKALEYAWQPTNEDRWDPDKSGVITGRQHHTLDMELFGANAWLEGFYLGALKAAARMAEYLGEADTAKEYWEIFGRGSAWSNKNLFNGEYFNQNIDLSDPGILSPFADQPCLFGDKTADIYWNQEQQEIKYQIGEGCMIDQVIGQWHANNCGLGKIFEKEKVEKALQSIFKYNYHSSMRNVVNLWRLYSINDEGGTMICTWPKGTYRQVIPLTYHSETMHGYEYQAAAHMIQMGMAKEAHKMVKAIRDKYDGYKRNPYNEIECGSNYARSMASYGLLLAYSGFEYDGCRKMIGFSPLYGGGEFQTFWSIEGAWGSFAISQTTVSMKVLHGLLHLKELKCSLFSGKEIYYKGKKLLKTDSSVVLLDCSLKENEELLLSVPNSV